MTLGRYSEMLESQPSLCQGRIGTINAISGSGRPRAGLPSEACPATVAARLEGGAGGDLASAG